MNIQRFSVGIDNIVKRITNNKNKNKQHENDCDHKRKQDKYF